MAIPSIKVVPDPAALAAEAAQRIEAAAQTAVQLSDAFSIALSGGNTPKALYELLAAEPYRSAIPWAKVQVFFADERCVPPDHPDSNFRMACQTLLDHVPIPYENLHRVRGEIDPQAAAVEYGQLLKNRFGDGGLDFILLGMGEDGHTASLFPHTDALRETKHRCVANHVEKLQSWRLTLTAPFLNRGRDVLILVSGAAKAARLQEVLEGPRDPLRLPVQLIDPTEGRLTWLVDVAAAGMA